MSEGCAWGRGRPRGDRRHRARHRWVREQEQLNRARPGFVHDRALGPRCGRRHLSEPPSELVSDELQGEWLVPGWSAVLVESGRRLAVHYVREWRTDQLSWSASDDVGLVIAWFREYALSGSPLGEAAGRPTRIDGHPAKISTGTASGTCKTDGGTLAIEATIDTGPSANDLVMSACLSDPSPEQRQQVFRSLRSLRS